LKYYWKYWINKITRAIVFVHELAVKNQWNDSAEVLGWAREGMKVCFTYVRRSRRIKVNGRSDKVYTGVYL
jgi:hypothetical protein